MNSTNHKQAIINNNGSAELSGGLLLPIQKQFKESRYFVINNNINNNYTYLSKDSSRQLNIFDSDHITKTKIDISVENNEVKKQRSYKYENQFVTNFSKDNSKKVGRIEKNGLIDKKSIILNNSESILNDDSVDQIIGLIKNISNNGIHDDLFVKNYRKYNRCKKTYFNILVSGINKVGKTTLIKKIISQFKNSYQNKNSFENSSIIETNSKKSSSIFEVTFDEASKRKYKKTQFFKNYELILNNKCYGNYVINLIDSPFVEEDNNVISNNLQDVIINKINSCHDQYHIKLKKTKKIII